MSRGRVAFRAFCSRPTDAHTLAKVTISPDGVRRVMVVRAVRDVAGFVPAKFECLLSELDDERTCCACGNEFFLHAITVRELLERRVQSLVLEPTDFIRDPARVYERRGWITRR